MRFDFDGNGNSNAYGSAIMTKAAKIPAAGSCKCEKNIGGDKALGNEATHIVLQARTSQGNSCLQTFFATVYGLQNLP